MRLSDSFGQSMDFAIPDRVHTILFNLSGGADSAILLYMLCDYIQKSKRDIKVDCLTLSFDGRYRWQNKRAATIIEYCISTLDFHNIRSHHTLYHHCFSDIPLHAYQKEQWLEGKFDILMGGNTANPRWDTSIENKDGEVVNLWKTNCPTIEGRNKDDIPQWTYRDGYGYYSPFSNVDKRFVAEMYVQYGVEDLLTLTRSCCADIPDTEPPCGNCWSCVERKLIWGDWNYGSDIS